MLIGVISDTHGLLRPEAVEALSGVHHILHAGDIGTAGIADALTAIAPVTAIRGNVDTAPDFARFPHTATVRLSGRTFHMVHAIEDLDLDPRRAGVDAVVYGHSHKPSVERVAGVLYLNPGSAGPRRFRLPVSVATLDLSEGKMEPALVHLVE